MDETDLLTSSQPARTQGLTKGKRVNASTEGKNKQ